MPYIEKKYRDKFVAPLCFLSGSIKNPGELTYILYKICLSYINTAGKKYVTLASVIGCLCCTVLELYRRVVAPYENKKINENGDL